MTVLAYVLPTGNSLTLWVPGRPTERLAWGELRGLGNEIVVLSPDPDIDVNTLNLHDNVFRPVIRTTGWAYRYIWVGRLMLWGIIWILGMDSPVEDMVGGIYLLLGLPLFVRMMNDVLRSHIRAVQARFESLFYSPEIRVVYSERLFQLQQVLQNKGAVGALQILDELGLQHLREFYKRCAWQEDWRLMPPSGAGILT